jgi:endonuclease YncB( thermonuclease family)
LTGTAVRLSESPKTKNTAQLRFEGIDAIEKKATQPLATDAKENMFKLIGYTSAKPEPEGYVLARMTDDKSGRPISFVFAGKTSLTDGSEVKLTPAMLKSSVNYKQMRDGYAYPLYYNTLFADLRSEFNNALRSAKQAGRGYWPKDATKTGVTVNDKTSLAIIRPIWPKLWRRLEEYLRQPRSLAGFVPWLAQKNERIDILSEMEERGLQDLVKVTGKKVRLTELPDNLRVRGKAGKRK